ncbi:hypothetical protein CUZ56_00590 [Saezia sanguinis]|uniref:MPN domain-containing protein n=1 Tax=Saezia sanguinis TaxID=1965230 RepID=A0A433SH84_9BURK|nr:JAB domain-containing protein [Saezia sanguinis]RUS68105.1 hypothetical protein CUZ56_00590 [Saezia sanguinis]
MDIKLTSKDKKYVHCPDDVFGIMQRILLRENKIDKEKEHFWIIGLDVACYILYIELVTLGTVDRAPIEPMNVYRVAVMKNATHVIAVHNHPAGTLSPSEADKDITDRLIQVGRILNIRMEDHLIISTTSYVSFKCMGLMDTLEQSLKYVPTYQIIEQIRKEEKAIAKEAVKAVQSKVKEAKEAEKNAKNQATTLALALIEKGVDIESIAKILEITPSDVEKMINKKK